MVNYVLKHAEEKATPILILLMISSVTNTHYCLTGKCSCSSLDLFQRRMRTSWNNFYSQYFDPKVLPISVLQMIEFDNWGPHLKTLLCLLLCTIMRMNRKAAILVLLLHCFKSFSIFYFLFPSLPYIGTRRNNDRWRWTEAKKSNSTTPSAINPTGAKGMLFPGNFYVNTFEIMLTTSMFRKTKEQEQDMLTCICPWKGDKC